MKRILSFVLAIMVISTPMTFSVSAYNDEENTQSIVYEPFDGEELPIGFGIRNNGGTAQIQDGKLYFSKLNSECGGLFYDLSSIGTLIDVRSERLVFEYDFYPQSLNVTPGDCPYFTEILDNNNAAYAQLCMA